MHIPFIKASVFFFLFTVREMTETEGTDVVHDSAESIRFADAVGLLWYTLFVAEQRQRATTPQKRRSNRVVNDSIAGIKNGSSESEEYSKDQKGLISSRVFAGARDSNTGHSASLSSLPAALGSTARSDVDATTTTTTTATTTGSSASDVEASFDSWGNVDWVLLAAHVYALTRGLHTDTELRGIVVHDLFDHRFHRNADAMVTALASMHRHLLTSYSQAEAEERARVATVTAASALAASSSSSSTFGLAPTASTIQLPLSAVSSASLPSREAQRGGGGVGRHGSLVPITAGIVPNSAFSNARPATPSPAPSPPVEPPALPTSSPSTPQDQISEPGLRHGGVSSSTVPTVIPSTTSTAAAAAAASLSDETSHRGSSPVQRGSGRGPATTTSTTTTDRFVNNVKSILSPSPSALPRENGGEREAALASSRGPAQLPRSSAITAARTAAAAGDGGRGDPRSSHLAPPFSLPAALLEPDPFDAPWYALWCSLPSPQARTQLQVLRFHTPLPLEDFSSLLEQFFLVEGADDFLNPVHAATIMEFAGVRSGPYHSIVRAPLSLAEVRRYITESHRHYARAVSNHHEHGAEEKSRGGRQRRSIGPGQGRGRTGQIDAGGGNNNINGSSDAQALLCWTSSNARRVLTLAELERSVWHIAANCVVFNAPESRYPRTARRFAASCIEVITRYCEKQMAAFLASS